MSTQGEHRDTEILIVEDEPHLADAYAAWLKDEYSVEVAYTGQEALDVFHPDVDIVLLDRRLPDIPGDDILGRIREQGVDCQVAMVSAVEPGEKLLKLDIDEYLKKPVSQAELMEVVEELRRRHSLEGDLQTYLAQLSKKRTLEAEQPLDSLVSNSRYQKLLSDLADHRSNLTNTLADEAKPRTRPEHHYSLSSIASGLLLIGLLVALPIVAHLWLAEEFTALVESDSLASNPVIAYPASLVHLSDAHLFGNVAGFLVAGLLAYGLSLRMLAARWFYATTAAIVGAVPLGTFVVVYGPLAAFLPGEAPLLVGFSGIVSAFVGFSFLAFLSVLRLVYEPRGVLLVAGFTILVASSFLLWLHDAGILAVSTAGSLVVFSVFVGERNRAKTSRGWRPLLRDVGVAALVGGLYAGLAAGVVVQTGTVSPYTLAGHLVALVAGFVVAALTAFALNVFPVRDSVREKGYVLPDRLL